MQRNAIIRIVAPTLLTAFLFVVATYWVLIPGLERVAMDRKREMLRELTISAWNVLANYEEMERAGLLSRAEAQEQAVALIRHLHYGPEQKDYFWINDLHPRMIMHPYRTDLEGRDLSDYEDPDGRKVFIEAAELVRASGEGFLSYRWQRRDLADEIAPKSSFVKGFAPWEWVIGTGVYIDDVQAQIRQITRHLTLVSTAILAGVSMLLLLICIESLRIEKRRKAAADALARAADALRMRVGTLEEVESRQSRTIGELRLALDLLQPSDEPEPAALLRRIEQADAPQALAEMNRAVPAAMATLMGNGASALTVNRYLAAHADATTTRLIALALRDLGPPPVDFAFLALGSQGRREQTLKTDQDNAIIHADPAQGREEEVSAYFLALGARVCDGLAAAGYAACEGGIMAKNPAWCRPLSGWRRRGADWIAGLEAEDLLHAKIFFDYRPVFGSSALVAELTASLRSECASSTRFFPQMARTILLYAPPLGLFGGLATEARDDQRRGIFIKEAMTPIVDFARIYAWRQGVPATGTAERLQAIAREGLIPPDSASDILRVLEALMQLRVENQIRAVEEGREPDNVVEVDRLTHLDKRVLKEAFSQIKIFQSRLGYDFTGMTGGLT